MPFTPDTDQEDFLQALAEYGCDAVTARCVSENTSDLTDMPAGNHKFSVAASPIEGQGIVATGPIAQGETIGPARINSKRTPLGRYTNHAKRPNAVMIAKESDDVDLLAVRPIQPGDEITVDYRQVAADVQKLRCNATVSGAI